VFCDRTSFGGIRSVPRSVDGISRRKVPTDLFLRSTCSEGSARRYVTRRAARVDKLRLFYAFVVFNVSVFSRPCPGFYGLMRGCRCFLGLFGVQGEYGLLCEFQLNSDRYQAQCSPARLHFVVWGISGRGRQEKGSSHREGSRILKPPNVA
jgi:hypothetical protein